MAKPKHTSLQSYDYYASRLLSRRAFLWVQTLHYNARMAARKPHRA